MMPLWAKIATLEALPATYQLRFISVLHLRDIFGMEIEKLLVT